VEDKQVSLKRKRHNAKLKFEVALETAKGQKTVAELASEHQLHPSQISQWKRQLMDEGEQLFRTGSSRQERNQATLETDLYEQIGRLKMELEWLKKKLPLDLESKRTLIELNHPELSIRRQCELIGLNRASYYY
jgi:putative transposase